MQDRLLTSLSSNDSDLLLPSLRLVDLPVRHMLFEADAIIGDVYFMESGFASVVARAPSGDSIEVGIIGREGMVGVQVILGQNSGHSGPEAVTARILHSGRRHRLRDAGR